MATIHQLAARLDHSASRSELTTTSSGPTGGRSAKIILFTGVRYERWAEPPPSALEAALSVPVDETGVPRAKGPGKDRLKA